MSKVGDSLQGCILKSLLFYLIFCKFGENNYSKGIGFIICLFFRAWITNLPTSCIGLILVEKGLLRLKIHSYCKSHFLYLFVGTQKNCLSETVPLCTQMARFNRIWAEYLCRIPCALNCIFICDCISIDLFNLWLL